jgi:hypothetical protein
MNEFEDFYEASFKDYIHEITLLPFLEILKLKMKNSKLICKKLHQNHKIIHNNEC